MVVVVYYIAHVVLDGQVVVVAQQSLKLKESPLPILGPGLAGLGGVTDGSVPQLDSNQGLLRLELT